MSHSIYVNDLSAALLDLWVARAEGLEAYLQAGQCILKDGGPYSPLTNEALGKTLVEQHGVEIFVWGEGWAAELQGQEGPWGNGKTEIEAVLRAIVGARFGDCVNVPEEEMAATQEAVAGVSDALEPEAASPAVGVPAGCFWLVFLAGENNASGEGVLGHVIAQAGDVDSAVQAARPLCPHPEPVIRAYRIDAADEAMIPQHQRNCWLTPKEVESFLGGQANF